MYRSGIGLEMGSAWAMKGRWVYIKEKMREGKGSSKRCLGPIPTHGMSSTSSQLPSYLMW